MNLKLWYPFKKYFVTQKWGNAPKNPDGTYVYQQFGFTEHNGIDAIALTNQYDPDHTTWPIYCPAENMRVHSVEHWPNGGGNMLFLISKSPVQMFERTCYVWMVFMHCKQILVDPGYEPALGELLAIADNTGFSTGPHTHFGIYRVDYDGTNITQIDKNDAENSFDPSLFWTGAYAVDQADIPTLVKSNLRYYKYKVGL